MEIFWADQKAKEIVTRKKFRYIDKEIPEFKEYVIKTSASISGVLHIGRLSDSIRGDSVCRALLDKGYKAKLVWVAEDMDPLRKIPEGVPPSYEEYIGLPVVKVPDPWGCHDSYAEHHVAGYKETLEEFLYVKPEYYSMQEEYNKGSFKEYIKAYLENLDKVIEIQNKYREKSLQRGWSPWLPVCKNCGKIITPRIEKYEDGKVYYKCEDYAFEKHVAKGCGYEGIANPLKDEGKLLWKGEWAAQWARWRVVAEGAGKEYVVPTSAWWVNAELVEKILNYPMPVPIFYEHLMIDGKKMSASIGNVVYPRQWLEVATPQLLRFFYNKKLMKTRSFSWSYLPMLFDEYDRHARVYFGLETIENEKERKHMQRLYEISQLKEIEKPLPLSFSHASLIAQLFESEEAIISSLKRSSCYDEKVKEEIMKRIKLARNWARKYAPEHMRYSFLEDINRVKGKLDEKQKTFLTKLAEWLEEKPRTREEIHNQIYILARELDIQPKKAFQAIYLIMLGKLAGPKAGTLLASLDRKLVIDRLRCRR
ncbi:MAG: lysine--tRNA ligase [Candidatus Hydrothermarchaeota archaeon]|nr:MAG: lysine--tRNA ligase [Candidatus Hydrothermarchaeota archaeon]